MSLLDQLGALASDYAGSLRVSVKTNLGPEITVTGQGSGLADALGLKAAVIIRDAHGRRVAGYGDPPATDPVRVAVLVALAGLVGYVLLRGVFKR